MLILWYGGAIAMSVEGASVLTVGSLIKYQLYWNMINNAYQSLNNVLNQVSQPEPEPQPQPQPEP